MKNKVFLAIIVVLLLGAFFLIKDLSASKKQPIATAGIYNQDALEEIYSSSDLKRGFGVVGNNICYLASDFTIKFYNLDRKQATSFSVPRKDVISARIISNGSSCITQLTTASGSEIYFSSETQTSRMNSDYEQIESVTGDGYSVSGTNSLYVLGADGSKIKTLDNQGLFKVAPAESNYYLINDYDEELAKGDLSVLTDTGTVKISSISDVTNLFANQSTILIGLGEVDGESVSLRSDVGDEIKKINNIDSSTVVTTKNGYLLASKLDVESQENHQNSLIYLSNNGSTQSLLSTVDGSSEQYNITKIVYQGQSVYFLQNDRVYKISKDLDLC